MKKLRKRKKKKGMINYKDWDQGNPYNWKVGVYGVVGGVWPCVAHACCLWFKLFASIKV